ncbi:carboxypeptidase B [Aedes aegypti]|uniref:Peptidase M14 domain-containing protein n=1 Tax=Aedes aegypti TaxID=7159 RepID=A0A1S4EZZ4_AEDAE|nr:carboxypeptidase B [Aedes aegypti]
MKLWLPVLGCLLLVVLGVNSIAFTDFQLYVITPATPEQLDKVRELEQDGNYDFWDVPRLNRKARVMVSNYAEAKFEKFLEQYDIDYDSVIGNVQQILDKERRTNDDFYKRSKRNAADTKAVVDFDHYWTLDEIYTFVDDLATSNPSVKSFEIGRTPEGRPIKALTISKTGEVTKTRPVVFMDAGIHAREWAGVMSVVYMIEQFTSHPEQYADQLDNTDYVIIPVLNPDGYVYTHEVNRLWRKNRVQNNILCAGVDLNRNFPFKWAFTSNACTNTFAGMEAATESETQAMMSLMDQYKSAMTLYIAVHTHGEMILWPWGYDFVHCDNWEEHDNLGKVAQKAIKDVGGNEWIVGNSADVLYRASGATDDYAFSNGARLAYTIELTGGGLEGFDLPASELGKVTTETMEIYKAFGKYAGTLPLPTSDA